MFLKTCPVKATFMPDSIGFEVIRRKGSHNFLQHVDGRCTVIPIHAGETIGRGLLSQMVRDREISAEELKSGSFVFKLKVSG
ncbi:MAG: hypothetical protein AUK24_06090 [Syntrophaceae bacterium CG2_30_49_12]|nr:MAG: hypothetical protein AUK24_06090 [Syntrophaceae bacterium CG2_30_49_12]PIP07088.1 MAG: hypothetical protein COX52_05050 [Syntrophobacterales bacterium CG23_combo_of_CG06-09_8_20_14_all_48_27]PJC74063.1 MAG: hypothetical protein CO012_07360 [Syntrophobacterales bacterium CG_4_8_14_3_um_filter_49_14]